MILHGRAQCAVACDRIVRVQRALIRTSVSRRQIGFCVQVAARISPFWCPAWLWRIFSREQMPSPAVPFTSIRTGALAAHGADAAKSVANKRRLGFVARCSSEGAHPSTVAAQSPPSDKGEAQPPNPLQRARRWFFGGKLDKERLKSLGFGALIAYGCASCWYWPATSSALHACTGTAHMIATVPGQTHTQCLGYPTTED